MDLTKETPVRGIAPPIRDKCEPTLRRVRVFLAEDDPDMRWLLASMLRAEGCEVVEAADGHGLLDRLASALVTQEAPDLDVDVIITDISMPGPTGLELLAGFRRAACTTPIILMTAHPSPSVSRRALALGATALLPKPLDLAELRCVLAAELAAAIARRREQVGALSASRQGAGEPHLGGNGCTKPACSSCGATVGLHPYGAASFCRDCRGQADPFLGRGDYCDLGGES